MPTIITLPDDIAEQLKHLPDPENFVTNLLRAALQCRLEQAQFPENTEKTQLEQVTLSEGDINIIVQALEEPTKPNEPLKKALQYYKTHYEH